MSYHLGDRPSKNIPWAAFNADFPGAFGENQWIVVTAGGSETPSIDIIIFNIPSGNGLIIRDIEYRVDGGQPISLGVNKSGIYRIFGFEEEQSVNIELRTVTRKGVSDWSDIKGIFVLLVSLEETLFADNAAGVMCDISDISTLFQDTAGTVPVTAPGQTVALVLDKSGNGNHATQATTASRPTYGVVPASGRRNILVQSENAGGSGWAPEGVTIVEETGSVDAPTAGPVRVWSITETDTNTPHRVRATGQTITEGVTYTASIYAKAGTIGSLFVTFFAGAPGGWSGNASFNLTNGTVNAANATIVDMGNGWYRCALTTTATGDNTSGQVIWGIKAAGAYPGNPNDNIYLTGRMLEIASETSHYQRTGTEFDVTEEGQPNNYYLYFDGVNDFMTTPVIVPDTDKVQVFSGLGVLSAASIAAIIENGNTGSVNNTFGLYMPGNFANRAEFRSRGTQLTAAREDIGVSHPNRVYTGLGDVSNGLSQLRRDGEIVAENLSSQGTGNFAASTLRIGARGDGSLFYNGHIYALIVRTGPNLNTAQISRVEKYISHRTAGVSL